MKEVSDRKDDTVPRNLKDRICFIDMKKVFFGEEGRIAAFLQIAVNYVGHLDYKAVVKTYFTCAPFNIRQEATKYYCSEFTELLPLV